MAKSRAVRSARRRSVARRSRQGRAPASVRRSIQAEEPPRADLRRAPRSTEPDERPLLDLIVITGMSGSGKGSVLKAFEDLGYYCVDNLPVALISTFARLCQTSQEIFHAALVVDIRERGAWGQLPAMFRKLRSGAHAKLVFLEASDEVLMRRYSETRRPHPLANGHPVAQAIRAERQRLRKIRARADVTVDTTKFNIHELRDFICDRFKGTEETRSLLVSCTSFGYRHGIPSDSDLVFDLRFLPNPNYVPQFRHLTGKHPGVARYIKSFPQTEEFIQRISELLIYLIPHYIREGKSYLTIAFGCTAGQHRSVTLAETIRKRLSEASFNTKVVHRDINR